MPSPVVRTSSSYAIIIGVVAAIWFAATAAYKLDRAGLYYDELHQATGSFAYLNTPTGPTRFARAFIFGVPLMNMPYSGAIKTGLYGLYLRVSGRPFSVVEWRLIGILFAAAGIVAFATLTRRTLPVVALAAILVLILTDATLWLDVRYDWGPIALAFLLRMLLLAVWLRGLSGEATAFNSFLLGLIAGFAVYEKVNSIVLVAPLALMLVAVPARRHARHLALCALGFAIGVFPLAAVNLHALVVTGRPFSLPDLNWESGAPVSALRRAWRYLAVANGLEAQLLILEARPPWWTRATEVVTLGSMLLLSAFAYRRDPKDRLLQASALCFASYVLIGVAVHMLPRESGAHHWIAGTPFQYVAIGLALAAMQRRSDLDAGARRLAVVLSVLLAVGVAARLMVATFVGRTIEHDHYSIRWDPSLTTLAEFTRGHQAADTTFVSTTWGIGTQIYCFVAGRPGILHERFQVAERFGFTDEPPIREIVRLPALRRIYVLKARGGPWVAVRENAPGTIEELRRLGGWVEKAPPVEIQNLKAIEVRLFVRDE